MQCLSSFCILFRHHYHHFVFLRVPDQNFICFYSPFYFFFFLLNFPLYYKPYLSIWYTVVFTTIFFCTALGKPVGLHLVKISPKFYWNWKLIISVRMSAALVSIVSQMNLVDALPSHLFRIHFIIIVPSIPGSSKWYLYFGFSNKNPLCMCVLFCYPFATGIIF